MIRRAAGSCCHEFRGLETKEEGFGSPAWIRTTIHGSKGRCPTIRRPGNIWNGIALLVYPSVPLCRNVAPPGSTMESGRQSGLVFGAVFKTVRRLLKSLVCSIRTVFRHLLEDLDGQPRGSKNHGRDQAPFLTPADPPFAPACTC